jgi:putative FmdB family regulatory protein
MATYEYKCKSCRAHEVVLRSISDKEVVPKCKACNLGLTRVYSNVGVAFSGSGFYSNDKG